MKTKLFLYISAVLLLASCKRYADITNANPEVRVSIVSASATAKKQILMMADSLQSLRFEVAHDVPSGDAGGDISISFKSEASLVQDYNKYNETDYLPMPAGSYELPAAVAIKKGQQKSGLLKIGIKTNGALQAFKQYLLPVSIDVVNDGFIINKNAKTTYFLIETLMEGFTFKVMSYGKGGGVHNMELAANIINQHKPDLLLVREMDSVTNRNGKIDQPAALATLIGMPYYIYLTSIKDFDGGGQYGSTIYSKFPIISSTEVILPNGDANTERGPFGAITVKLAGQNLVFAGTHLNANATRRAAQLPVLLSSLSTITDPLILVGNFNDTPPAGNVYTALAGAMFNFPCTSCPPNTPVATPTSFSDFILFKPSTKLRVVNHSVGTASTSTHLPVITEFRLFK